MSDPAALTAGAPPARGIGPQEGIEAGLVWPRRVGDADGPTPWQARSGAFRKTGWGLYVPAETPVTARQRVVEASALWPNGVVTGWGGLAWRQARWFEGTAANGNPLPVDVHVGVGRGLRRQRDVATATQESVPPWAIERRGGIKVALAIWAVAFAMRLRAALQLLSENSWSPQEPLMRCAWSVQAGRPMPLANRPVFDLAGRHVGTPDIIDAEAGVYGQYEGAAVHLVGAQRSTDIRQDAAYRDLGLEGVTMVAARISTYRRVTIEGSRPRRSSSDSGMVKAEFVVIRAADHKLSLNYAGPLGRRRERRGGPRVRGGRGRRPSRSQRRRRRPLGR